MLSPGGGGEVAEGSMGAGTGLAMQQRSNRQTAGNGSLLARAMPCHAMPSCLPSAVGPPSLQARVAAGPHAMEGRPPHTTALLSATLHKQLGALATLALRDPAVVGFDVRKVGVGAGGWVQEGTKKQPHGYDYKMLFVAVGLARCMCLHVKLAG